MRLIDADALLEALKDNDINGSYDAEFLHGVITNAPTVQREPVNEGYPLIRLGYGLVEVGTGEVDGEPVVVFTNHGNGVIGDNTVEEPRVNDPKDVYAAISITNLDSLNVVRKQLDIFASKYLNEVAPTVQRDLYKQQRDELLAAAKMSLEMIESDAHERRHVRWKLKDAIEKVENEK